MVSGCGILITYYPACTSILYSTLYITHHSSMAVVNKEARMLAALGDCHNSPDSTRPNFSRIAETHTLDRNTLRRHFDRSLLPISPIKDTRSLLSPIEENVIISYLEGLSKRNFFVTPTILRNIVCTMTGKSPCQSWARKFVQRHKEKVKVIKVGGMEASRHAAEYEPTFKHWFDLVSCSESMVGTVLTMSSMKAKFKKRISLPMPSTTWMKRVSPWAKPIYSTRLCQST